MLSACLSHLFRPETCLHLSYMSTVEKEHTPVSYTHLDVYKRQTIYSVSNLIDMLYFVLIYT